MPRETPKEMPKETPKEMPKEMPKETLNVRRALHHAHGLHVCTHQGRRS
jgi:hypothetical protein